MAAVAGLSPFHFARQFKAATGLPPHQFVILCRVDRATFSDQSQLSHHFKGLVGVTPGQVRKPARTA
jgi:AraC family transcriptional regulator